jgi:hypothetical protein
MAARRALARLSAWCAFLPAVFAPSALEGAPPSTANTLLLEPETFAAHGGWEVIDGQDGTTEIFIKSAATGGTALAGFNITTAGTYKVWALSRDFDTSTGTRRFKVMIDGVPTDHECGAHGVNGWLWEQVYAAPLSLAAGTHTIEVIHINSLGRLEAVLITSADLDPNAPDVTRASLNTYNQTPLQAVRKPVTAPELATPSVTEGAAGVAAELQNTTMTLRFRKAQTVGGQDVLLREVEFRTGATAGQSWRAKVEPVHLITSATSTISQAWAPRWKSVETEDWEFNGATWTLPVDSRNAFLAGDARARYLPETVEQTAGDGRSATIRYKLQQDAAAAALAAGLPAEITVAWSLPGTGFAARMEASLTAVQAGWYSLAFAAGGAGGFPSGEVVALQLPPLYQFKRAPDVPVVLMSSVTPHPLALVETSAAAGAPPLTHGVIADPGGLIPEWAARDNATCGFSLRGREGEIQPAVFAPLLGGSGSQINAGGTLGAAWWVTTAPQSWLETMRDADTAVLKLRDYREPWNSSITRQALNIINLIKSGPEFRWYDNLKGPSNIEAPSTATQSAPLMLVSAARLTRDAEFYKQRGLPSLEFALSRPYAHYATSTGNNGYVTRDELTRLNFNNRSYGTAAWQGFDELLGGLNPWLRDNMKTSGGQVRPVSGVPTWSEKLALYRSAPAPALLAEIVNDAKTWAASAFDRAFEPPVSTGAFYNVSFYPYWWDLLDLYELTGDPDVLAYARQGAAQTAAGQWVHPIVPENATVTLYPGGRVDYTRTVWWDGDERKRLGWPPDWPSGTPMTFDILEKTVPAWLPATAGLGLEQPSTYFTAHGMSNIMNTTWAANLLRLSAHTGEDYWRTHARNALIGRGSNYPGYYLSLYIDLMHDPEYPDKGPDLTSFYWHHAPVHLAMLVDFLVTDADARTDGAIRFPYVKSQGYVWFSSRIYGGQPGRIFDDANCWLWLDDKKFNVDTPKVDYLGARSDEKFHLVVLNQARDAVAARVYIDTAALGIAPAASAHLRDASGAVTMVEPGADGKYPVSLAHRGWAVLTFDAAPEDAWPACPALSEKPVKATIDAIWGDMHAFRIRSPHGTDSFYVGLTGMPDGGKTTLVFEDAGGSRVVASKSGGPYEISAHDISFGDAIRFKLQLEQAGGATTTTSVFTLNGTGPATPGGLSASDEGSGRAGLLWTPAPGAVSYKIKRAASPGGPFQMIARIPAASGAAMDYIDGNLVDNQDYYYAISAVNPYGESPDSAIVGVSIINSAAPKITAHPVAQSAECGTQITLSVSAAAETGLVYQWLKDGVAVTGANSPTLLLAGLPSDSGIYRVRITGKNGATLSDPASITITPDQDSPLLAPVSVTVDDAGILYVSDEEKHVVHILTPPGSLNVYMNTFAGTPGVTGTADATGTQARFNRPLGLAARAGALYVADFGNGALRAVTTGREVGTLATGDLGGTAGITTDTAGNIYAADKTSHVIRKIEAATGARHVIAGQLNNSGTDDGNGTGARFNAPAGIAWSSGSTAGGVLYIADTENHAIRKMDLGGGNLVTTLAGNAGVPGWLDGAGDDALFNRPEGITADIDGTLYIADTGNSLIREIAPGGPVSTVAGGDAGAAGFKDATGTNALFNRPRGVALGRGRELYIADTGNRAIRRIDLNNNVQTLLAISSSSTPGQNPEQPGNAGGGGGGGALSSWYFIAFSALILSKAAGFCFKTATRLDTSRK